MGTFWKKVKSALGMDQPYDAAQPSAWEEEPVAEIPEAVAAPPPPTPHTPPPVFNKANLLNGDRYTFGSRASRLMGAPPPPSYSDGILNASRHQWKTFKSGILNSDRHAWTGPHSMVLNGRLHQWKMQR